ncbi:MAG TPA: uracil-DNA glycosylase [Acidimicrobiia bacterium]|nr:uracil-DNA glycosylase [Acidimicrobiia bacterium]
MSRAGRDLVTLTEEIIACRACPRLVEWREQVAREKRAAYRDQEYWGRPAPGFGDPRARVLLVGLAPAAHGANRTGRVFTGDRSGDFLFASLFRTGFANQPESVALDDGLELRDAYIAAAVRCAPPANKPTPAERDACLPFLVRELKLLTELCVIVALGGFGYEAVWTALRSAELPGVELPARRPKFAHGLEVDCGRITIVCTFHPSQQNTFTGRLTPEMQDEVFRRARSIRPRRTRSR